MKGKRVVIYGLVACLTLSSMSLAYADNDKGNQGKGKKETTKIELIKTEDKIQDSIPVTENILRVSYEKFEYSKDNIVITMNIPVISGLKDLKFQYEFNKMIADKALKEKDEFLVQAININAERRRQGYENLPLEFKYDFFVAKTDYVLSMVVQKYKFLGGANGISENEYYNIDIESNKTIILNDLFIANSRYIERINAKILEQIAKDKAKYYDGANGFKTITAYQNFYLQNGNLVIAFPKYSIAPGSTGIPEFKIPLKELSDILVKRIDIENPSTPPTQPTPPKTSKKIEEYKWVIINGKRENLNKDMYKTKNGNIMIPVSKVARALGYKVKWNPKENTVTLDEGKVSTIYLGSDKYAFSRALIKLEEEAITINGTTFVPISFFEELLGYEIYVDDNGLLNIINITR